jgi:putative ABC transport system permease protein
MSSRLEFRVRAFVARLRGLLGGGVQQDDYQDEVQQHLQMLTERFRAQGMSAEDAARAARLQFGNTTLLKEDRRELQSLTGVEAVWLDFRYAIRTLSKSRAFAAVTIATLGLGIGAATAIFSVIDNVLLAPFPYQGAERIVFPEIHGSQQGGRQGRQGYTGNEVLELASSNHVFDGTTAAKEDLVLYRHGEGTDELYGAHVTPGTFEFFGMPALYGRVLEPSDYEPGAPPVFVLRYKTWKQKFNSDLSVLNKSFVLNGVARTPVGIMPPRFAWYDSDVYIPEKLKASAGTDPADFPSWFFVGRLKPGISTGQAQADLQLIANNLAKLYPKYYPAQFTVLIKLLGDAVFSQFRTTLYTVLAAVGLLLLIACSNVANLMLARTTMREKEIALRSALGARRARIIRMLMIESLVLALAGAAFGVLIAWGGLKVLVVCMPSYLIPAETVIQLNAPVLAFTLGLALLTPLIFGLAPALQLVRRDLNNSLRDSNKGVGGGFQGRWLRDAVVVAEVALSLTLLVGAGLLSRSFVALLNLNLGLRTDHVLQTMLVMPAERYKTTEQITAFSRPLLARVEALPGVVDAAQSSSLPPYGGNDRKLEVLGKTHSEDWHTLFQSVTEGYFRTLRIELKQGRTFSEGEVTDARKLAVVNETFTRRYLGNENPIGQRVRLLNLDGVSDPLFEIIGVVGDVTNRGLQAPIEPELWVPHTIGASPLRVLIVRSAQDISGMMDLVRKQVWATDPGVALAYSYTLEDFISERMYAGPKFGFVMMCVFGCVGLILVTIGVYSVLAYATARKTHEIGIRIALGAKGADVLGLIVGMGFRLVAVGISIGIAMSLVLGRFIGTELVGINAYDPATLVITTLVLILTAALACWVPARRAWRVNPLVALRYE